MEQREVVDSYLWSPAYGVTTIAVVWFTRICWHRLILPYSPLKMTIFMLGGVAPT